LSLRRRFTRRHDLLRQSGKTSQTQSDERKLKILLHDYGGYPFTRQLAEALACRDHIVQYCYSETTQHIKRTNSGCSKSNLTVIGIQLSRPFEKYSLLQRHSCEIEHGKLLAEQIGQFHPDVVISADTPLDAQGFALKASRNANAQFLFWFQDAISIATRKVLSAKLPVAGDLIGQYYGWIERQLVRQSDQVILISDDFLPLMNQWGVQKERVTIIPNWAPVEEIPVCPKSNQWAVTHGLTDQFVFLYSGILGLKHNPILFIQLSQAFQSIPDVKVVIVAEGAAAGWLKEQKEEMHLDNLLLFPYQPAEVYPQMLGSADVLMAILSPDAGSYSVPSKVLSYMCASRSLLLAVPAENLAARLVVQNDAGLVSSPLDTAHWIRNAKSLYLDRQSNWRRGAKARKYAENFFNIKQITDKFEALF